MHPGTTLALAGAFVLVAVGGPVAIRLGSAIEPSAVMDCKIGSTHGPYMQLTLASGHRLVFTRDDLAQPAECLLAGTVVEKRALELGFRIDGAYERPASASWRILPALLSAGICLFVIGLLWRRSCR